MPVGVELYADPTERAIERVASWWVSVIFTCVCVCVCVQNWAFKVFLIVSSELRRTRLAVSLLLANCKSSLQTQTEPRPVKSSQVSQADPPLQPHRVCAVYL